MLAECKFECENLAFNDLQEFYSEQTAQQQQEREREKKTDTEKERERNGERARRPKRKTQRETTIMREWLRAGGSRAQGRGKAAISHVAKVFSR